MREEHDIFHAAFVDEEIIQAELHQLEYQQSIKRFPNPSLDDRVHMVHMLRVITQQETQNTMNDLNQAWQRIVTSHQYETHVQPERTDDTIKHPTPIWNTQSTAIQRGKTSGTTEIPFEKQRSRRMLTILSAVACITLIIGSMLWIANRIQTSKVAGNQHSGKTTSTAPSTPLQTKLAYTYTQTGGLFISSIRWSPAEDHRLLSVGATINVWDFTHTLLSLKDPLNAESTHTVWSPDGTSIAINNGNTGIEIRDATTGQLQRMCATPTPLAQQRQPGADIPSQQQSLLSAKVPYTSRFADGTSGGNYFNLAWSPDGKYLAATFPAFGANPSVAPFAGLVVFATADCSIVWQPSSSPRQNLVTWSPDSNYLALSNESKQDIEIINFINKQTIYTYHASDVTSISWSPDGKRIAMYHSNGYVSVSDALTGADSVIYKEPYADTAYGSNFAWSPDSKYIVSTSNTSVANFIVGAKTNSNAHIWNATTGQTIHTFVNNTNTLATAVAWSPDGDYIAISYFGILEHTSPQMSWTDPTVDVWQIPHL